MPRSPARIAALTLFLAPLPVPAGDTDAEQDAVRSYEAAGVVKAIDPEKHSATIAHEEIPGYMRAMTMELKVRDAAELDGLAPGDTIRFRLRVTDDDGWIDRIRKSERAPAPDGRSTPAPAVDERLQRARALPKLVPGDALPDQTFVSETGESVRLSEFRGGALALTFIFTRCPFPTYCPRLSSRMEAAQAELRSDPAGPANWHFASITLDPEYDTPERLARYAAQYHAEPDHWQFLTGDPVEIAALAARLGVEYWRDNPDAPISHNLRTAVIDANGRVQWIQSGSDWEPETLVKQMRKAARVPKE